MRDFLMKLYVKAQLFREDNGQDLIEYALVAALIALAATAGMSTVAANISTAFTTIGGKIVSYSEPAMVHPGFDLVGKHGGCSSSHRRLVARRGGCRIGSWSCSWRLSSPAGNRARSAGIVG